jgi:hypothetical protein
MSFTERRAYPRYKINIPVRLENSEGLFYETETKDISFGGMQVECSGGMLYRLLPNGMNTSRADRIELIVQLHIKNEDKPLSLITHVQGVLRLAETNFLIRLLFVELNTEQKNQLQKLLKQ